MAQVARRICLIGPESTGKTELAKRLAQHLDIAWTPEFAREYAEARKNQLSYDDVEAIARGQLQFAVRSSQIAGVTILDTDLISTVVYARHYYGRVPDWIAEEARKRKADLYLLMSTDVPWVEDIARDAGGDAREALFDAFRAALAEFEATWVVISGSWDERFEQAVTAIRRSAN